MTFYDDWEQLKIELKFKMTGLTIIATVDIRGRIIVIIMMMIIMAQSEALSMDDS